MKILVANLGSTSFKHRLFDMDAGRQLARGGIERIGSPESRCTLQIGDRRQERTLRVADHAEAVRLCLAQLTDPESGCLKDAAEVSAIAFKTVHGGVLSGVRRVTPEVIEAMERAQLRRPGAQPAVRQGDAAVAGETAANPPGRLLRDRLPRDHPRPQPLLRRPLRLGGGRADPPLGIPRRQPPLHCRAHRGTARPRRLADHLLPPRRLQFALRNPQRTKRCDEHGHERQSGLPQNNRCGDFDAFAIPLVMERTGKSLAEVLDALASQGGLLGLSGVSNDFRDIEEAAAAGNARASSPWMSSPRRRGTISGPISSSWAAPTRSSSPAGSARTARPSAPPSAQPGRTGHFARRGRQRRRLRRGEDQFSPQPRADLGRPHQRGTRRRPPGRTTLARDMSHVYRQSRRLVGQHAEGRRDDRP